MKHDDRYVWLDLARGLSALAVCAAHLRAAMFVDFGQLAAPGLLHRGFYFATGLGYQAVMAFFVLSGFFVGGGFLKRGKGFRWGDYALARMTRLWVVLVPALALTFLVDLAIEAVDPAALAGEYRALWNSGPPIDGSYSRSALTIVGNILFLQTIAVPVFGSNTPLWSLANEFWYYLVFPLAMMALGVAGKASPVVRLGGGVLAVAIVVSLPAAIAWAFVIWLLGVGVWFVEHKTGMFVKRVPGWGVAAGLAVFVAALVYSKAPSMQAAGRVPVNLAVGVGFAGLALVLVRHRVPAWGRRGIVRCSRAISEFSYSLYLVHFPLVILIGAGVFGRAQRAPSAAGMLAYAGWFMAIVVAAAGFWWLFEKRTTQVRRWLKGG